MGPATHTPLENLAGERLSHVIFQPFPSENVLGQHVLREKQGTHAIRERDELIVALHEVRKNTSTFLADHTLLSGLY